MFHLIKYIKSTVTWEIYWKCKTFRPLRYVFFLKYFGVTTFYKHVSITLHTDRRSRLIRFYCECFYSYKTTNNTQTGQQLGMTLWRGQKNIIDHWIFHKMIEFRKIFLDTTQFNFAQETSIWRTSSHGYKFYIVNRDNHFQDQRWNKNLFIINDAFFVWAHSM